MPAAVASITVKYARGVYLPEADLWLDPAEPRERAFVSHAHADHFARHRHILCSTRTRDLIETRYGGKSSGAVRPLDFGETFEEGGFRIRLLPAGHIFGSAQIHLTRIDDGASLLYSGDFKLRPGLSCEPAETTHADTVIMETTFGLPRYQFPPTAETVAQVIKWVHENLEEGRVPVLLGYSLGKAQEILSALDGAGIPVLLHEAVHRMTGVYARCGDASFPEYALFDPENLEGKALIFPPNAARSQALRKIKKRTTAMLSGWACDPGAKFRYQVDTVFPLSDHADYPDLLRYVEEVDPARVLTLHGFAAEFARDLRERGREAWSLTGENQLDLGLGAATTSAAPNASAGRPAPPRPDSLFGKWVDVCDAIADATGKLQKINHLAAYLKTVSEAELEPAVTFLTGRAFERRADAHSLNVGWAVIRRALLEAAGIDEAHYRRLSQAQNDPGRTAYLVLLEADTQPRAFSLCEMRAFFKMLAEARGPHRKTALLAETFTSLHPLEAQYVVKILTGDLRIGLSEGLLEDALAAAFDAPAAEVRESAMLLGSIARTASLASRGRLAEADLQPHTPLKCMLASPEENAAAIWRRLAGSAGHDNATTTTPDATVWLEDKFDGIRAQLHKDDSRVSLFSRDLRALDGEFPELITAARALPSNVILDGEIIAYAEGRRLTFFDLQKRLGRRAQSDLFIGPSIPVRFIAFDLLWHDGVSLLRNPLRDRRARLESVRMPAPFEIAARHTADSPAGIDAAFKAARARDNEGLIAKDPESLYTPGRRGKAWLKLKKAFATLDVVVVKAQWGHGKRSHVLSDYTFAVRDEETGALSVIGKAYSGLTDAEIETLTEHFQANTLSTNRRTHTVVPDTVLEIAFDSINPSKRHGSGLALRFPRINAIRRDKTVDDIDTVAYARKLAGVS